MRDFCDSQAPGIRKKYGIVNFFLAPKNRIVQKELTISPGGRKQGESDR